MNVKIKSPLAPLFQRGESPEAPVLFAPFGKGGRREATGGFAFPRLAHHCRRASGCKGFTLIELLVVVVIISITLSLVVVNFARDDKRVLTDEAQRMGLLLEHAHDEAVASAQLLAWSGDTQGYRFAVATGPDTWTALNGDEVFRERAWSSGVKFGGVRVLQGATPAATGTRLTFSPSGFNAPFEMTLAAGDNFALISADPLGRIALKFAVREGSAYHFGG